MKLSLKKLLLLTLCLGITVHSQTYADEVLYGNTYQYAYGTAWCGIDYVLLLKQDTACVIEHVLWEGPLQKNHIVQEQ